MASTHPTTAWCDLHDEVAEIRGPEVPERASSVSDRREGRTARNVGFGSAHSVPWAGGVLDAALDGGFDLSDLVEVGDQRGELDVDLAHCVLEAAEPGVHLGELGVYVVESGVGGVFEPGDPVAGQVVSGVVGGERVAQQQHDDAAEEAEDNAVNDPGPAARLVRDTIPQ